MTSPSSPTSLVNIGELRRTSSSVIEALAPHMTSIALAAGECVYREGDPSKHLYFLVSGSVRVTSTSADGAPVELERLLAGAFVGERELFTRERRQTTVTAVTRVELRALPRSSFAQLRRDDVPLSLQLLKLIEARLRQQRVAIAVRALFPRIEPRGVAELLDALRLLYLGAGQVLFRQGTPGRAMYIVVSGRLSHRVDGEESHCEVGEAGPGDLVGAEDLFHDADRPATVVAKRDTNVLRLDRSAFEALAVRHPALGLAVAQRMVEQSRRDPTPATDPETRSMTIAVLSAGGAEAGRDFAVRLAEALAGFGSALVLTAAEFDRRLGEAGAHAPGVHPLHPLLQTVLDALESEYRFVLFVPDADVTEWTCRCVRKADRILIVADADADPAPSPHERTADALVPSTRRELVLLQPRARSSPRGTRRWLQNRHVTCHHHVRRDEPDHVARVARRLAGRAIGLVLSGGGARGFAHLGVWRSLEELSVSVDYVGGTSMGALIAAGFAMGMRCDEARSFTAMLASPRMLFDRTIPFVSLMSSRKLNRLCRQIFGERPIEDLWIPYFAVVTNLSTAEPTVRRTGPLWRAVRSSIAIPGVFAPVIDDDEVLVDGGVMNNFPVDLMRRYSESDHVIAVNVIPPIVKKKKYDYSDEVSGWRILLNRLNPFARRIRVPNLVGTLLRALEVNSVRLSRRNQAEAQLLLEPDVRSVGLLDFARHQEADEIGHSMSKSAIQRWLTEDLDLGTQHVATVARDEHETVQLGAKDLPFPAPAPPRPK